MKVIIYPDPSAPRSGKWIKDENGPVHTIVLSEAKEYSDTEVHAVVSSLNAAFSTRNYYSGPPTSPPPPPPGS